MSVPPLILACRKAASIVRGGGRGLWRPRLHDHVHISSENTRAKHHFAAFENGQNWPLRHHFIASFPQFRGHILYVSEQIARQHEGVGKMAGEMRDGIRKVLNKRASKSAGKTVYSYKVPYRTASGKQ